MSIDGRGQTRRRMLRRAGVIAAALVILALWLLSSSHWVFGIIFGVAAIAAVWVFLQMRSVR